MRHTLRFLIATLVILIISADLPIVASARHRSSDPHHRLVYRGGEVMSTTRTYAIFWLPPHFHFEPHGDDNRFRQLIEQFLQDVGGTPFYNVLTQYSRGPGAKLVVDGPMTDLSGTTLPSAARISTARHIQRQAPEQTP
jgi:hypothetical protein